MMALPVSPWYDKQLEEDESANLPDGFRVVTARSDIHTNNFLVAISNQSVPPEAVMCYANFVCESILHGKKHQQFTMPATELKKVGDRLTELFYGDIYVWKKKSKQNPFCNSIARRAIEKNKIHPQRMLSAIFKAGLTNETGQLTNLAQTVIARQEREKVKGGPLKLLQVLSETQPDSWDQKLQELGFGKDTTVIQRRVTGYCLTVLNLYGKAFFAPFLFKVKGHAAFLVNMKAFFDESCLPTMEVLNKQFKEGSKLNNQDTVKKELQSVSQLVKEKVISPPGREETFMPDLVRFLYEILGDDTTIGRKNQGNDTVENIAPYLLRTRQTTLQRAHLDSEMGTIGERGTVAKMGLDLEAGSTRRMSTRPRKVPRSYNEADDPDDPNDAKQKRTLLSQAEADRTTRTYLPWSMDIPLIDDSFFLNLWLIDHGAATKYIQNDNSTKINIKEDWQIGIRIEVPSGCVFLWRNDLVHSGCYAGPDLAKKRNPDAFDYVHPVLESNSAVSNCERMHAYLPTTEHWQIDVETRTPSTYGILDVLTPFDGTLASSKKRREEKQANRCKARAEMASYIYWPDGRHCCYVSKKSTQVPENRTERMSMTDSKMASTKN